MKCEYAVKDFIHVSMFIYFVEKSGLRRSMKADVPSIKSGVPKQAPKASTSA
jgi:hypothetical protein